MPTWSRSGDGEGYPGTIGIDKKDRGDRIAVGEAGGVATHRTLVIPIWGFLWVNRCKKVIGLPREQ